MAEDKNIVECEIYKNRNNSRNHRDNGLVGFAKGTAEALRKGKGQKTDKHNIKVIFGVFKGGRNILGAAFSFKIKVYKG